MDHIIKSEVKVLNLSIITNGTCYTQEIERILKRLDSYIRKCRQLSLYGVFEHTIGIELSVDEYHESEMNRIRSIAPSLYGNYLNNVNRLLHSNFFATFRNNKVILNEGRAKNLKIKKYEPYTLDTFYTEYTSGINKILHASAIYIDVNGDIKYSKRKDANILNQSLEEIIKSNGYRCESEEKLNERYNDMIKNIKKLKLSAE